MFGELPADQRSGRVTLLRLGLLCVLAVVWLFGKSVFAPWAVSPQPRLWLYDTLLYSGFALYLWGLGETIRLAILIRRQRVNGRRAAIALMLLTLAGVTGLAHHIVHHTATGWTLRTAWSQDALQVFHRPGFSDQRQRVGWLIIDSVRAPCETQPWLWLGRPFGAGSGINRALVFSPTGPPRSPHSTALAFVRLHGDWWMAYQNSERYYREPALPASDCVAGTILDSHRKGASFITQ